MISKLLRAAELVRQERDKRRCRFNSGLAPHGQLLTGLVRSLRPQTCVEIGSARGYSACHIGAGLKANGAGKLYAIDPHEATDWNDSEGVDTHDLLVEHVRKFGVQDHVEVVREYSTTVIETWNRPIDLLFIDGDHSYEGVRRDWEGFAPHLTEFGVALFHDTGWEVSPQDEAYRREDMGVPQFVDELRREGYPVITLPASCGLSIVQGAKHGIPLCKPAAEAGATA